MANQTEPTPATVPAVPVYDCSFCTRDAVYVGRDHEDGDFYCEVHKGKALGGPERMYL